MNAKEIGKVIAAKVGTGICYGIGISMAVFTIVYGYESLEFEKSESEAYEYADDENKLSLEIKKHQLIGRKDNLIEIIGAVQNNSEFVWSGVNFEIEFYDAKGFFVYECNDDIPGQIAPMQSEDF